MESGWWRIETRSELDEFARIRERALERGARERERYEFLAAVGHELRTPLTSIRGYIETLLDGEIDAATSRRFLETARREALRLARLVDGMLEFSLLDLSPHSTEGTTDVGAAVAAALDALAPIARDAGVTTRFIVRERAWASIDPDACMHVLLKVIENAVKYCGRAGLVEISLIREDACIRVCIDDNGPGVDANDRERIFTYGERARAPEGVPGTGVGLAIVRTIVERAAGRMEVTSSPLGGARFIVVLPAVQAEFLESAS